MEVVQAMDFTVLRYFQMAAKEQSISRAADELYISRQALSKAIKRLEEQLGVRLITPAAQGIRLTPQGEEVYAAVQHILSVWDDTVSSIALNQQKSSLIRVGYGHNSYNLWPNDHMRRYMEQFPRVQLEFRSLPPDQLVDELCRGSLDLIISNVRPKGKEFACLPIVRRPVYALVSCRDALAGQDAVTPRDLHGRHVYFIPYDQIGMARFSQLMECFDLEYIPMVSPDSTITTLCNELAYHGGAFITSAIFWATSPQSGFLLKPFDTCLPHAVFNMDVNAITLRSGKERQDIRQYVDYLKENVKAEFREGDGRSSAKEGV